MGKTLTDTTYRWLCEPSWYLWEGGFLLVGRAQGVVPAHAHHAIQIVIAVDGMVAICGKDGRWRRGPGFIVRSDAVHSFDCSGALGAMIFVDPESAEGLWLLNTLEDDVSEVPGSTLPLCIAYLRECIERPFESSEVAETIRRCVHALTVGPPPLRKPDQRITAVLATVHARDDLRMSLAEAAELAFLSATRFAHLFKEQLGLPYSRYMLWRKLTRAMVAIASERTISDAAHAADFADSAHMTRTFYQMVGMTPSALMRGRLAEIPTPFAANTDPASGRETPTI